VKEGQGLRFLAEAAAIDVPVGVERVFAILDGEQAETLRAWCATLIPPGPERPGADEVGAAEYVDATCAGAPALADPLVRGLARLDMISGGLANELFRHCEPSVRSEVLVELERVEPEAVAMVRDFAYEAYYAHPRVLAVLEEATGWRGAAPSTGTPMEPFDERRLARVRQLPPLYRRIEQ
jgi:hypothetical protein